MDVCRRFRSRKVTPRRYKSPWLCKPSRTIALPCNRHRIASRSSFWEPRRRYHKAPGQRRKAPRGLAQQSHLLKQHSRPESIACLLSALIVVLQVAKELRQLIQQEMPQYRVVLTRHQDVFVPLAERARMANEQQAQVFISIHANSSPHREASGIETWYLSFAASARAKKIAARENMMSEQQLSTLELILRDLHETDRINQSTVLAQSTQNALAEHMAGQYPG